ncbi:MAG TPA: hypothetical protein VMR45_04560 [Patescibacteria group bacterium]|nr:hypothetical protein [Patescibacteria group bacterium]
MMHQYLQERTARDDYLERSRAHLLDIVNRGYARNSLGAAALRLQEQAQSFYIPEVTDQGLVVASHSQGDSLPVIALRDNEHIERDTSFATFAPAQYKAAPRDKARHLGTVANRVAAGDSQAFMAQTFNQDAAVMRMIYKIPNFPAQGQTICFNLRPLVLVRYDPEAGKARAGTLANAFTQASQVMENPVEIFHHEDDFEAMNAQWRSHGYELAARVDQIDIS